MFHPMGDSQDQVVRGVSHEGYGAHELAEAHELQVASQVIRYFIRTVAV